MLSQPDFLDLAGLVGVALYLGSYAGLQFGLIKGSSFLYAVLNLAAAALVLASLFSQWNLSSAVIQSSWIVISIIGIARLWLLRRRLRFDGDEAALYRDHLGMLRHLDARRVMDVGRWHDLTAGRVLTEEGAPVDRLTYLASGSAEVTLGGKRVAELRAGDLVGEFGVLTSAPASATVTLSGPARVFQVSGAALNRLGAHHGEIQNQLAFAFARSGQAKLASSNARASSAKPAAAGH